MHEKLHDSLTNIMIMVCFFIKEACTMYITVQCWNIIAFFSKIMHCTCIASVHAIGSINNKKKEIFRIHCCCLYVSFFIVDLQTKFWKRRLVKQLTLGS